MSAGLQLELQALYSCVGENDADRAREVVANIAQICMSDVTQRNIDFCCSLIFSTDFGLVVFLKKTVLKDEFQDCKTEVLEILQSLLKKFGKNVSAYSVDIKDVCVSIFSRDRLSKVKNAAVVLLIEILLEPSVAKSSHEMGVAKMIEKFMMELAAPTTKHSATVRSNLYHLLGRFAAVYPEHMVKYSDKLLEFYVGVLKAEMTSKTKKAEMSVIAGCFYGLTHLLTNFTHSVHEGGKYAHDIYSYLSKALDKSIQHSRYDVPRSALQLLAKHACQWDQCIIDDYKRLFDNLSFWSRHHNRDVLHDGTLAFDAFLKQVCLMLVSRAKTGKRQSCDVATFKFFIQHFREITSNPQSTNKEVSMAIRGYGALAAPCREFLSESDVRFMYNEMMIRSEQIYFGSANDMNGDKLVNLPSFLEAFSSIVAQLSQVSDAFLVSLERLVVLMVEQHPKLHPKMHYICYVAIVKVYMAVSRHPTVFPDFLSRTVYQSVIRTCCHEVVLDSVSDVAPEPVESDFTRQKITYHDYIGLWTTLLHLTTVKELLPLMEINEREILARRIYDELIMAILRVLSRLDLSVTRLSDLQQEVTDDKSRLSADIADDTEAGISCDPVTGKQASKPKDIVIFVNLVDFCREVLVEKCRAELFRPWIHKFGHEIIVHSVKQPLVSGLYKMFTACLRLCSKLSYFKGLSHADAIKDVKMEIADEEPSSDLATREACFYLFTKFAKEVSTQLKQYHDDLLAACLELILALPDDIVITHLNIVIPALEHSLHVGRSYLPLAKTALCALEHWHRALPAAALRTYYPDILPLLDAYLKSSANLGVEGSSTDQKITVVKSSASRHRPPAKISRKTVVKYSAEDKSRSVELEQVKEQCVRIIGMLGGSVNHALVSRTDPAHLEKLAVAWDSHKHLRFDFPFQDVKPTIYFDQFLPRVVELATLSSNRQTKIAACELLHALVIYMIGREVQILGHQEVKHHMDTLYRKIFPAVFQLVCDIELVARQLFKPLLSQLIHWFTSSHMRSSPVTAILIDTIMDGLVSSTDAALRDLSATSLKEFVYWSIKQSTPQQLETSPINVKAVLRRLYSYARHPSSFKRLGSALGFNNIYTVLREESSLVDMFIFDILVAYVESLSLAHDDDRVLGTQEQCKMALVHVERILRVKADLLNKPSKKRKTPRDWTDASLTSAVEWLLTQCGRTQTECRHACMQLVYNLSPCLPGKQSPGSHFSDLYKKHGAAYFVKRFECGAYQAPGSDIFSSRPIFSEVKPVDSSSGDCESFCLRTIINWLERLLTVLDCYSWIFGQNLIPPSQLLIGSASGSVLLNTLEYFVKSASQLSASSLAMLFSGSAVFSPREREHLNRLKCTVIVRMFSFLSVLLNLHHSSLDQVIPGTFWSEELCDLLLSCIMDPASLGFDMSDVEIVAKLPEEMTELLRNLHKSSTASRQFTAAVSNRLTTSQYDVLSHLPTSLSEVSAESTSVYRLISGIKQLQVAGYLTSVDTRRMAANLLQFVFQGVVVEKNGVKQMSVLTADAVELGRLTLDLSFVISSRVSDMTTQILDPTPVVKQQSSTSSSSSSCHGELFYATFKSTVTQLLITVADDAVKHLTADDADVEQRRPVIASVITSMLDVVGRDSHLRHRSGLTVVNAVLGVLSRLSLWWKADVASVESKMMSLTLLMKLILIDASVLSNSQHPAFAIIWSMYTGLLTDRTTTLAFKTRALDLLMFFVMAPEPFTSQLRECLNAFVSDNFPASSYEYPVGSPRYNEYICALDKILAALELSQSPLLLELLISIQCRERRHVYHDQIQQVLARYVKRLSLDKQKPLLDVAYRFYYSDECGLTSEQRRSALEHVVLHMLQVANTSAIVEFFVDHIIGIMTCIETPRTARVTEMDLVKILCSLQLAELMYRHLAKDAVHSKQSPINKKYCMKAGDMTGKEMTTALTKAAASLRSEVGVRWLSDASSSATDVVELVRLIQCAAYNMLIAVISSTQSDLKFYAGFLFPPDNLAKSQVLWEHLIDTKRKYTFPVEMERTLARQRRHVAVRRGLREDVSDGDVTSRTSVHYLASQYLTDSSLNTDVSQFDFATSAVSLSKSSLSSSQTSRTGQTNITSSQAMAPSSSSDSSSAAAAATADDDDADVVVAELEMDELNQHECMSSLISVLRHMQINNITPAVEQGSEVAEMPSWMDNLYKKFSSSACSFNIQLFIAKLILNTDEVFRPYAKFWLSPLLELMLCSEFCSDAGDSAGINYFINDVLVTLLSWHHIAVPQVTAEQMALVSRVLQFIMRHCHHDNRQVLRNNLEVLKTVVEVWRTTVQVPTGILYENLSGTDVKSTRNATGVQMVGVIVANSLLPYRDDDRSVSKDRFYKTLAMNMNNDHKSVYSATAEVVGMTLALLTGKEMSEADVEQCEQYTDDVVKQLMDKKPDRLITCLHCIQLHFPAIADRFRAKLFYWLPKLHGIYKTQCLEIICRRVDHFDSVYIELKSKGFLEMLSHRDEGVQLACLKLVHALLRQLSTDDVVTLLPTLASFVDNRSVACRAAMYDVFMWIYDNYSNSVGEMSETGVDVICARSRNVLLLGLSDEDEANRLRVHNFWSHETRLPTGTVDRLVAVLEAMYSPDSEAQFLSYATNFLLEMTSRSPDYNREMFEQPLSQCTFQDYRIESTWKQRHATMTPLFIETQSTLATQAEDQSTLRVRGVSMSATTTQLRMTVDVHNFTATQADGGGDPYYNWLTQSRIDTFADSSSSSVDSAAAQSSLLFTVGRSSARPRRGTKQPPVGPDFGKDRLGGGQDLKDRLGGGGGVDSVDGAAASQPSGDILRLRKRFVRHRDEESRLFFARRQTRLNQQREKMEAERKQKRENEVTMYRRYRIGDLPDIQIPYSAIIAPLQALAHNDSMIARLLFSSLLSALLNKFDSELTKKDAAEMTAKINAGITKMLSTTTQFFAPFIACLLDVVLENVKTLQIDASIISSVSTASQLQSLGILLLEECIMLDDGDTEAKTAKRARTDRPPVTTCVSRWIELSRLYKSLGEYDVVNAILSKHVTSHPVTLQAIDAEVHGDYTLAAKLYNQGLSECSSTDTETNDVELELWQESRLMCYDRLCQWDKMENVCHLMLSDSAADTRDVSLDLVWQQTFSQDLLLPYLIRSKVKRLLEGAQDQQPLLKFVDQSMVQPDRKQILESGYSELLSLLYSWQEDYDRAKYYANTARGVFYQDWTSYDELMTASRTDSLQRIQCLTELHEFLHFITNDGSGGDMLQSAMRLVDSWQHRCPDLLLDPPAIWDDVVTNRCMYMDHMYDRLCKKGTVMDVSGDSLFDGHKVALRLMQVEAASAQGNCSLALRLLKTTHDEAEQCGSETALRWNCAFAKTHVTRCRQSVSLTAADKLRSLHVVKQLLDGKSEASRDTAQQLSLLADTYSLTCDIMMHDAAAVTADTDTVTVLTDIAGCSKTYSHNQIIQSLIERGFSCLQDSVAMVTAAESSSTPASMQLADGCNSSDLHLSLYKYCNRFLRLADSPDCADIVVCPSLSKFPHIIVTSLIDAVKFGSREARLLFPRVLQIVAQFPDTVDDFIRCVSGIPCWMLLSWVSQLTAILDKPESLAVHDVLLDIAQQYPQALVYAFKLSSEGYQFDTTSDIGRRSKLVKDKLHNLLSRNALVEKFIAELEQFDQPNAVFKEWFTEVKSLLHLPSNISRLRHLYADMSSKLIGRPRHRDSDAELRGSDTPLMPCEPGPFMRKFREKFTKQLRDLCGDDGEAVVKLCTSGDKKLVKAFEDKANKLREEMEKFAQVPNTLKEYSSWMSSFQASHFDQQLEIPGQYTGVSKPMPEYHTKISSFNDTVLVLPSIRRPKRITVRGNDEKEYRYLVKCGEDLRQDQRIEQLLDLMNGIYSRHAACRQKHLRLRTYQVVPMTPRLGVIEWMDKTSPLKELLAEVLTEAERRVLDVHNPRADHQKLMGCTPATYHKALTLSRSEVVTAFRKLENLVPSDLLRRVYRGLSASSEAYYRLRREFAVSHAQLCISHYILGIGDRHLSNFMVDLQTGAMVGIDFGHAFGSATQFLPIPELVPFRLTRQLRSVMQPLQENGLMKGVMIHCLDALRSSADLLMTTMDVFIKEPSLDWQKNAEKQKREMSTEFTASDVDESWYPKEKVNFARRKLCGDNCIHIMRDELRLGHGKRSHFKFYEKVLMGDRKDNVRATLPASNLTVDQQVDCLIDLATDPNILGRFWVGWEPWM